MNVKVMDFHKNGGSVVCICGESGSGKSTLARMYLREHPDGVALDGDVIRHFVTPELGYSDEDRLENNKRVAAIAAMLAYMGKFVVVSTVRADIAHGLLLGQGVPSRLVRLGSA